jgi:hypothetical protein
VEDEASQRILSFAEARDTLAAYFADMYGIQAEELWVEQDITPEDMVGASRIRFVSGPVTIVVSAEAAAPAPSLYLIEEASDLSNGFYWEGTLSIDGEVTQSQVIAPAEILNPEAARDAVMDYLIETYNLSVNGEWLDQGASQTQADSMVIVFSSGPWIVEVEFAPAAPLVSRYKMRVENPSKGIRWEGEINSQGEIQEDSFSR